jgi:superfamily II DNA or RNA helicase
MAETALQETVEEDAPPSAPAEEAPTWREPTTSVAKKLASMSDRAIQRVTGGNAFLRGRLYARRKAVENLKEDEHSVSGEISVRTADEPYHTAVSYSDETDSWESSCTCPGWRGPTGHCKHVAAVMVALRDEVRPPRAKGPQQQQSKKKKKAEPVHVPGTVSVGGKRRRSRRRRRGVGGTEGGPLEVLSPRELQARRGEARGPMDAWLPAEALPKPLEFEYRMTVRPASIAVTPVLAGTRSAVPINDALGAFNMVSIDERPLFRALARNINRGQPTTAELRGEDAAEVVEMLSDRRVLLEPASMELRFANEALKPRIELDPANGDSLRVRVVFYLESNKRRFALSSGAWFEGTPVQSHEDLPELLGESIPRVAALLGADLPDLSSVADLVDQKPRFELKANGDIIDARVRLYVRYEDQEFDVPPDDFPSPLAFLPPKHGKGRPRVVRRDVGAEMAGVQALLSQNFEVSESGEELVASGDDAIAFWTNGIGELPEDWDRFIPDDLVDVTVRDESVMPQMRVSSGVDWLNLDMKFESGGAVVREEELRACLEHGRRLVQLEDGTYAPIDPDKVGDVLTRMAEIYATSGMKDKLPLSQAGRVQDLLKMVDNAKVSASAKTLFAKIEDIDEIPSVAKPRTLKADLRPYQKDGFSWLVFLHELNSGGILADDMGLGKTIQTIALLLWSKSKYKRKLNLVVAPTSVVPNWQREIAKFAPGLKTVVWQGPNRSQNAPELEKADVMITSYALLRRDEELLQALDLRYVILDEAQHIKNPMSQTARSAKKLSSERRLALTGTPIENRLSELWSIFDFVSPGLLGQLKTFEERIARPIDRGDMETAQRLRATIKPFVMRRLKRDVAADLPDKIEQEMIVPLAEEQAKLYKQVLGQVRKSVLSEVEKKGVSKAQIQILAALTRLRQVACDPRLMKLPDTNFEADDSGKLGALREIIDEAVDGNHRVLVFSQFVEMLNHIRAALDADGVQYEYLDGSTKDRIDRVDRFNEDTSVPVFLISLKAGGTGLNLTGADTVVHFDPWWNPAVEDQATDRAHRIGQTKNVNVYKLIAAGTVEEKILELSAKKRVLSTEGSPLKGLTKADVENLFSE